MVREVCDNVGDAKLTHLWRRSLSEVLLLTPDVTLLIAANLSPSQEMYAINRSIS